MWTSFVGFMASGKSSVASLIGQSTLQPVVDLDREVERRAGMTVPQIFQQGGVAKFRALETEALAALDPDSPLLLATGGGCVETAQLRRLLGERGVVIWLDAPWLDLRTRIEEQGVERRPMVAHLGFEGLQLLYERRLRLYAMAANFRLWTHGASIAAVARTALLRSLYWRRRWSAVAR